MKITHTYTVVREFNIPDTDEALKQAEDFIRCVQDEPKEYLYGGHMGKETIKVKLDVLMKWTNHDVLMKWTNQNPKVPGYYWYVDDLCNGSVILKVAKGGDGRFYANDHCEICFVFKKGTKADKDVRWSDGPIKEPSN